MVAFKLNDLRKLDGLKGGDTKEVENVKVSIMSTEPQTGYDFLTETHKQVRKRLRELNTENEILSSLEEQITKTGPEKQNVFCFPSCIHWCLNFPCNLLLLFYYQISEVPLFRASGSYQESQWITFDNRCEWNMASREKRSTHSQSDYIWTPVLQLKIM